MIDYSQPYIPPENLCRSTFPEIANFHDYIHANRGLLDHEFRKHYPFLTICKVPKQFEMAPPIVLVGSLSEQRKFFGENWAKSVSHTNETPCSELERASSAGYRYAFENGLFCQRCEAILNVKGCYGYVQFVRYIARIKNKNGPDLIGYISSRLNPTLQ